MADDLRLKVTLTGDGRRLSGTLENARGEVRQFGDMSDRQGRRASAAMDRTGDSVQTVSGHLREMNGIGRAARSTLLGVGTALAGAFAAGSIRNQARAIAQTDALANSLDVSTGKLQAWQYAGEQVGLGADKMGDIFKDTSDKLGDFARTGAGEAVDLVEQMGLNIDRLIQLSPDQQLLRIGEALDGLTASERTFFLESLADEAVRLQPLLEDNAAGLREYTAEAWALGVAMDDGAVNSAVQANRAMLQLEGSISGLVNQLTAELGPGLAATVDDFTDWIERADGAEAVLEDITDVASTLAVLLAGRYAGALATATAAKIAATQQAVAYQAALARMAGVSRGAAMAQMTLAGASRAAAGALALVGGPLGLLVGGAGLLYVFRDELNLTGQRLGLTEGQVENFRGELDGLSNQDMSGTLDSLNTELQQATLNAARAREELAELRSENSGSGALGFGGGETGERIRGIRAVADAEADLAEIAEKRNIARIELWGRWSAAVINATDATDENSDSNDNNTETIVSQTQAAADLVDQQERQSAQLESLRKELDPAYAASQRLAESTALLDQGLLSGAVTLDEYLGLWDQAAERFISAGDGAKDAANTVDDESDAMATLWDRRMERMDDASVDMWRSFLDGSENAFGSFKRLAIDTLAEVIHAYTTRRITTSIGAQIGGSGGQGAAAGGQSGGGGFGQLASMGSNMLSTGGQVFTNAWNAFQGTGSTYAGQFGAELAVQTQGGLEAGFNSFANSGAASNALSGIYTAGGAIAGSYLGGEVAGAISDKRANSNYGQMAGTAIGTVVLPGIGTAIGSALGTIADTLFGSGGSDLDLAMVRGSSDTSHNWDHGVRASGALGSVGFQDEGSHELLDLWNKEDAQAVVDAVAQVDTLFASIADNEAELQSMQDAVLSSNRHGIRGHYGETSNPGDVIGRLTSRYRQAFEAVGSEFLGLFDDMASLAPDAETIARYGVALDGIEDAVGSNTQAMTDARAAIQRHSGSAEKSIEAAESMASAAQVMNLLDSASDRLNIQFDATAQGAIQAASDLEQLVGGIDNLASLQQNYYDTMLTAEQRYQHMQSDMRDAFAELGLVMPDTRAGFRALVDAQDLNTKSGRRNYAQLLQLTDGFDQLRQAASSLDGETDNLTDRINGLKDDVKSAYEAFQSQAFDQRVALLELAGKGEAALALEREKQLESIDPLLHETQRHIWAMQDEAEAKQQATQAANDYAAKLGEISSALSGVGDWLDQRRATQQSPLDNRAAAEQQFERQLAMAQSGDRDALQSITQYADRFLSAEQSMYASGAEYQRTEQRVYEALEGLPEAISDAEYIVDGFRDVVTGELAGAIETAIFDSRYTIDTLIDFAANTDQLPADLRTILGEQAHRLDSVLNYLLGKNELDAELRQLALTTSNNLVSTIDLVAGADELTQADRRLALQGSNLFTSTIDLALGEDLTAQNRRLALQSANTYSSVIDMILGADLSANDRTLALESSHAYAAAVNFAVGSDISRESRQLALSGGNTYRTLMQYAVDQDISHQDRRLALRAGNRYASRIDMILRRDELTADDRQLALSRANAYAATVDIILGADISQQERQLALGTSNRLTSTIDAVLDSGIGAQERILAFGSANAIQTTISGALANNLPDNVRKMALQNANRMTTTVKGVLRNTPPGVRKFALERSNALTATVSGVLASSVGDDVKTLALKQANTFMTTLRTALDDNAISADERKLLDARSEQIVKTLRTDGGLDLTNEEWAVISAASGSKRLQLLADVAFNQSDLSELDGIQDNTKSMEERARDQLDRLNDLVANMTESTEQLVSLDSSVSSLASVIDELTSLQKRRAQEERQYEREMSQMQYYTTRQATGERLTEFMQENQDAVASARRDLNQNQIQSLSRFVANNQRQGPTAGMDQQDWERIRQNIQSNDNLSRAAKQFVLNLSAYRLRRGRIAEWERIVAGHEFSPDSLELDGSHATGLRNVPFNGYIAELHKDELVATAEQAPRVRAFLDGELPSPQVIMPPPLPSQGQDRRHEEHLLREANTIYREIAALLEELRRYAQSDQAQRGEGFRRVERATERGNKMLERLASDRRLEEAKV